ncbi:hypothetical protein RJ640_016101 [Escallonia rubra]|uniref:NAC domain-containing protein n=1 Tax=Escallonia rubra TaxID=112253 RepID=A0AA88UC34_9ASTE|nr:hypothetical protein RJ640_016101 [Escallonia rubra]
MAVSGKVTCSTSSHGEDKVKQENPTATSSVHGGRSNGGREYPSGYHFVPTDFELICYLLTKIVGHELPPNTIEHNADLYEHDPEELPAIRAYCHGRKNEAYFFTHTKPSLTLKGGYWKACCEDAEIFDSTKRKIVGFKKTLVFYRGKAPEGEQTPWLLHEYRVDPQTITAWLLQNYGADPNVVTADHAVSDRVSIELRAATSVHNSTSVATTPYDTDRAFKEMSTSIQGWVERS